MSRTTTDTTSDIDTLMNDLNDCVCGTIRIAKTWFDFCPLARLCVETGDCPGHEVDHRVYYGALTEVHKSEDSTYLHVTIREADEFRRLGAPMSYPVDAQRIGRPSSGMAVTFGRDEEDGTKTAVSFAPWRPEF